MGEHHSPRGSRHALVERFFSGTGPSYDLVVNVATFGIDRRWKGIILGEIPGNPQRILDLACGTGILTLRIARRFPECDVVGVELRNEYLDIARAKAAENGIANVDFVQSPAEKYFSDRPFDCIVSSYLAKYIDLNVLAENCEAMLRPGGKLVTHDFTYPPRPYLVRIWRIYFRILQMLGSPLLPQWREIFFGLPSLIERSRWVPELEQALKRNAFEHVRIRALTLHGSALVTAHKPGRPG